MSLDRAFGIVLDLRCLQDPRYAMRGIGRHALVLLRHAPRHLRLIGVVDEALPPLPEPARAAVACVHSNGYSALLDGAVRACVLPSPMTHDPLFLARLLANERLLRVAVVYDFIPHRWPARYLPGLADRLAYATALRWLARCDLFAPISRSSADDLHALTAARAEAVAVTGSPLDAAFENLLPAPGRHVLMVGGADRRKNPELVIRAHAASHALQRGLGVPLVIAGDYGPADAASFRALAAACGGRADLVEVPGQVPDDALRELYRRALALVCPSRDEGFSIPIIEGMAAGAPCLVSDIPAHAELVAEAECRFAPDDHAGLCAGLERALSDTGWRSSVLARQAAIWPKFRAASVADRFWNAVLQRLDSPHSLPAPALSSGRRPRVALLSPVPPDRSGVADYTAATCAEFGKRVELHVFTETEQPASLPEVASIRPIGALPHLSNRFDRVVSVAGNSEYHARIIDLLLRYGGACVAHDARLLDFYVSQLGKERALAVAEKELGRAVSEQQLDTWLRDESRSEAMFLGEIMAAASPAIVHSNITARLIRERYGMDAVCLPFSVYRPWRSDELATPRRAEARARLGVAAGEVIVATFGFVHGTKAPEDCVWALELLRGWGIPASLHFVGDASAYAGAEALRALIASLGLAGHVRLPTGYVSEQIYRDTLLGADVGLQLRTYGWGSLSGGLLDAAAAGLPSVTTLSLGDAIGVPAAYTRCVPDAISALLVAEALADLLESGLTLARAEAARLAFSEEHSFARYADGLGRALGLDAPVRPVLARTA